MTDFTYNPADHYWSRANGKLYSSRLGVEVAVDDAGYQAWLSHGDREPTPYPKDSEGHESPAELAKVLAPYGLDPATNIRHEIALREQWALRSQREILAAQLAGRDQNPYDVTMLATIQTEITALRGDLAKIEQEVL